MATDRFVALRDVKVDQIRDYYSNMVKQVVTFANDYTTVHAVQDFTDAFNNYTVQSSDTKYRTDVVKEYLSKFTSEFAKLNDEASIDSRKLLNMLDDRAFALQYNYILQNPYNPKSKSKYNYVPDNSKYSAVHKQFHPIIRAYQEEFKYSDILLVDAASGNVVYSVQKELDFTSSLISGPYAKSAIGQAFALAMASTSRDFYTITDFHAYLPAYNNVAAFIAAPIFDDVDKKIGVLILRISPENINRVMTSNGRWEQSGWGKTGESYILGSDSIMRTMSRFFVEDPAAYTNAMQQLGVDPHILKLINAKQTTIGLQKISSVGAREVVAGNTGVSFYRDYRNQPVIATYQPLQIPGLDWGIICGIDTVEAFCAVNLLAEKVLLYSLMVVIFILAAAIYIGLKLSAHVSKPIERLKNIIYLLAKKQDLTKRIRIDSDDELGEMAKALNTLLAKLQQAFLETIESSRMVQSAASKLYSTAQAEQIDADSGNAQESIDASSDAADSLQLLSAKLENLSKQFKIFEEESERTSGW